MLACRSALIKHKTKCSVGYGYSPVQDPSQGNSAEVCLQMFLNANKGYHSEDIFPQVN